MEKTMLEQSAVMLNDYRQFDGLHWETGTIRNALDYQGVRMPHTGQPPTEALLFGISGGVIAGYFTFEYAGLDPWLHFITRNTLEPMPTLLERLHIPTQVKQTKDADRGVTNLVETLAEGKPALVWADAFSLPYNSFQYSENNWALLPILVFGYDEADDRVQIADRARVPLTVTTGDLAAARARTDSNKYRLMTLGLPDLNRLPQAVEAGIRFSIQLMTEEPPKAPMKGKFGLDAFQKWADALIDTKSKNGWAKAFPPGVKLYSVLKSAFYYINLWGTGGDGARSLYVDFLDEAAVVLSKPALNDVSRLYRASADCWQALSAALLPESCSPLKETRALLERQYRLFIDHGGASLPERQSIKARLQAIRDDMAADFPLSDTETAALRENLREAVLQVHAAERAAVTALREAIR